MNCIVYRGANKKWYWKLFASNGREIAQSAQGRGYSRRKDAREAFMRIREVDYIQVVVKSSDGNTAKVYGN